MKKNILAVINGNVPLLNPANSSKTFQLIPTATPTPLPVLIHKAIDPTVFQIIKAPTNTPVPPTATPIIVVVSPTNIPGVTVYITGTKDEITTVPTTATGQATPTVSAASTAKPSDEITLSIPIVAILLFIAAIIIFFLLFKKKKPNQINEDRSGKGIDETVNG